MSSRSRRTAVAAALSAGLLILVAAPPAVSAVRAGPAGDAEITPGAAAVSASTSDDNEPANVLDGDEDTRWSGHGDGAWLQLDLGGRKKVSQIKLAVYHGDERQNDFLLQVGDGTRWTTVYDGLSSGRTTELQTFDFADVEGSKIRYVGRGHLLADDDERQGWNSLTEVEVWGAKGSGGGGGGGGQTGKPATVLNLTDWKIQLPSGSEGHVDEVRQPALKAYSHDTFFTADGKGGVRFRAPVNGATTSGSAYPRSELREMTDNGTANAAWSADSGTHTLVVDEAITKLPNDKPHVVGAQIHGGSDDVSVFRLEGTSLWITNGDEPHHKLVTSSYRLGTRFQAKFVVSGGRARAYYNGVLQTTIPVDFSGGYFKAGAYTQANCENSSPCSAGNYGETRIYRVAVEHR